MPDKSRNAANNTKDNGVINDSDVGAAGSVSPAKKPNRKRSVHFNFFATPEDAALIKERMTAAGMVNMSEYLRKMAITGYHINLDLSDVREMVRLLSNVSNNVNQLTRRAHQTHNIYAADIEELRLQYDTLWEAAKGILEGLARIK